MHTENRIVIAAPPTLVFDLAAGVAAWPSILPHYRSVRQVAAHAAHGFAEGPVFEMRATRTGIPVSWTAIQQRFPDELRVRYHHVAGVTAGMDVEWRIEPSGTGSVATIDHDLTVWRWWMRPRPSQYVVGHQFVMHIAQNTLRGIAGRAEALETREKVSA